MSLFSLEFTPSNKFLNNKTYNWRCWLKPFCLLQPRWAQSDGRPPTSAPGHQQRGKVGGCWGLEEQSHNAAYQIYKRNSMRCRWTSLMPLMMQSVEISIRRPVFTVHQKASNEWSDFTGRKRKVAVRTVGNGEIFHLAGVRNVTYGGRVDILYVVKWFSCHTLWQLN